MRPLQKVDLQRLQAVANFVSDRLAAQGLDPLPDHIPNYEVPVAGHRYPLAMISPPARNFLNSSFVNVESLRAIEKEPLLEICAADAATRGIATGDTVKVFNDRGEYHCKADVTSRARPGVVNGLGIWWRKMGLNGTNVNEVTSQLLTDLAARPCFMTAKLKWHS
jgi:anaerobic selenocysteine-containing dehydrogenase